MQIAARTLITMSGGHKFYIFIFCLLFMRNCGILILLELYNRIVCISSTPLTNASFRPSIPDILANLNGF